MIARLRSWQEETHRVGLELLRHFLARVFDSEMVSTPGEWQKVAIGFLAALFSVGLLVVRSFMRRYTILHASDFTTYSEAIRNDVLAFIALAMAATALLTILQWHSLFPSLRDCLALAGLPVSARQIFAAKFGALVILFTGFVLVLTGPLALMFASVTGGRWQENPSALAYVAADFSATAGACVFVFFSLLALQGILLNLLPGRLFERVSLAVQAGLFILTLGVLPLMGRQPSNAFWWPPVWFLRLWESIITGPGAPARNAILAMIAPAAVGLAAYLISYRRYQRLLLEAPPNRARVWASRAGSWLLERSIRDPREQAAFAFIWKTLARSRGHRLILLAYAGLALGWIVAGALDTPKPSLENQGMYGLFSILVPLALAMLVTIGLRYVFSWPVTLSANWVFQIADREGRRAWLSAAERFVVWCGIAPIFLAGLPASLAILGWLRATAAVALAFLMALVWFEGMFRAWRKLPFTCSYLPGKKPVWLVALRYFIAIPFLAPIGQMVLYCSGHFTAFVALATFLIAVRWKLRSARCSLWSQCALQYEEASEADLMLLDLQPAEEQEGLDAPPAPEAPMFSGGLVASRGVLPQEWAEEIRQERGQPSHLFGAFLEDVRYGFRLICRAPLTSAVVVLTLTVGIGINASVFTVVNGFAFRPHVSKNPDSFVRVIPNSRKLNTIRAASYSEYLALRQASRTLAQLAAWTHFPAFIGDDNSAGSVGMAVSCNFFRVDGLDRAVRGRLLEPEDCRLPSPAPVAVISESLWRARFAADPGIAGRVIELNNRPVSVVGVVPDRTAGWTRSAGWTRPASIWIPFTAQAYFEPTANLYASEDLWLSLAGRLAPGFSRSGAETELNVLARRQDALHPGRETEIETTDGSWIREIELTLTGRQLMLAGLFVGAFNLVLFIACANVATLLLARASTRQREIAVRLSLGAPRVRLVRMLLTESLLLASIAGAASAFLAARLPAPLFGWVASRAPDFPMPPDWRTFMYVAGAVLLTGVLAGLAPALVSVRVDLGAALKGAASSGVGVSDGAHRIQSLLVSAQVAMSMALLAVAAVFAQAENHTLRGDPGFLQDKVVVAPVYFPDGTPRETAAVKLLSIVERVQAIPGVRSVGFSEGIPLLNRVTVEMSPPTRLDVSQPVDVYTASPRFFETLGIRMLQGREFQLWETNAIIVSRGLARAFWPRESALGKVLSLPGGGKLTVAGVAENIDPLRFGGSDNPALYRPWVLNPIRNVMLVRFDHNARTGAAAVRAVVREQNPNALVMARRFKDWIDQVTEDVWNAVAFILILGVVATLLAATGIYGAVSFAVSQRTKEMGIRMALGAQRRDIVREVFVSGGKPVLKGLLAGLWLSVAATAAFRQGIAGTPIRLDTANPLLYCGAAVVLTLAAVVAMLAPARRGSRADPMETLRAE